MSGVFLTDLHLSTCRNVISFIRTLSRVFTGLPTFPSLDTFSKRTARSL